MPNVQPIRADQTTENTKAMFDAVNDRFGTVPNLIRTLGHSPAALKGYLDLTQTLGQGVLPAKLREQLALTISEANGCGYCVAAHCAIGKSVGLNDDELADARQASSPQTRTDAALRFARQVVERRGQVGDEELDRFRRAGYGDAEIVEIVAIIAWMTLSNYMNLVAGTEVDFPAVAELAAT